MDLLIKLSRLSLFHFTEITLNLQYFFINIQTGVLILDLCLLEPLASVYL